MPSKLAQEYQQREEIKELKGLIREVVREEIQSAHAGSAEPGQSYEDDIEQLAESAMTVRDMRTAERRDLTPSQVIGRYGVNVEDYLGEPERLRKAVSARRDRD